MGRAFVKLNVVEKDTGWEAFQALVRDIQRSGAHVKVGVLEGVGTGSDKREGGVTNAELAAIHEFGTADGHIPERSFLRSTFNLNMPAYLQNLRTLLTKVLAGEITVEKVFNVMGARISTDVKKYITTGAGVPPPNAPSTLARKIAKGAWNKRGTLKTNFSPRPLVDTGRLLVSITWAYIRGES